ncbi:MAG: Serine/threonine protein kinase [Nocardioides sp.]|nr:Serine/threonine protein kinase [Nocardioides sp.]
MSAVADPADVFDGRYVLQSVLGSGGTGTVHRAWDRVLDRPVALKLLRAGAADDDVHRARLRAEARLAGVLHHPGIAQVYDYGEASAGDHRPPTPYIVMQYVDGVSLAAVLAERRRLPPQEVMELVAQVAEALRAAHERGIVHRDLKPANILVTPQGRPVLVDFGIARSADLEPLTLTGTIVGSVDYISPEQTAGGSATPLSDVYALGLVAYEALSGRRPFRRESQVATALAHLHDEVPPLEDDVPHAVRSLVLQMVDKDPAARPAGAAEVADRAAGLAANADRAGAGDVRRRVVLPPPAPPKEPGRTGTVTTALAAPWLRSRRIHVGVAVLVAAVAAAFVVSARPVTTRVPDLRGMPVRAAVASLHGHHLDDVRRTTVDDPTAARGTVLGQDPKPGAQAGEDTVVVLQVASGRERLDEESLLGDRYARAAREVVALGMVPLRATVARAEGAGTVVAAGPAGHLPLGSIVTLTVAVAPAPTSSMTTTTTRTHRVTKRHAKPPRRHAKPPRHHGKPPGHGKHKSKGHGGRK